MLDARPAQGSNQVQGKLQAQVVCCYCSRVLGPDGVWREVPGFDPESSQEVDSHGICPTCYDGEARSMLSQLRALIPGIDEGPTRIPPGLG